VCVCVCVSVCVCVCVCLCVCVSVCLVGFLKHSFICALEMQRCTQFWGRRPFGVGVLLAGFDVRARFTRALF
jgi:hypothetical protein